MESFNQTPRPSWMKSPQQNKDPMQHIWTPEVDGGIIGGGAAPLENTNPFVAGPFTPASQTTNPFVAGPFAPPSQTTNSNRPPPSPATSGIIGGLQGASAIAMNPSMSVEERVAGMMNPSSQLGQIAKTTALQQMNERGLANSSLAVSAAQDALYKNVLPIAQQDAQTGYDLGKTNNAYANQFARDNNMQINELQRMARSQGYNLESMSTQQIHEMARLATNQGYNAANRAQDFAINSAMQGIQSKYANILQGNSQASSLMSNATSAINNITNNSQMDANAKTIASQQVYDNLNIQLQVLSATAGLNLGQILNPYTDPAASAPKPTPPTQPAQPAQPPGIVTDPSVRPFNNDLLST